MYEGEARYTVQVVVTVVGPEEWGWDRVASELVARIKPLSWIPGHGEPEEDLGPCVVAEVEIDEADE